MRYSLEMSEKSSVGCVYAPIDTGNGGQCPPYASFHHLRVAQGPMRNCFWNLGNVYVMVFMLLTAQYDTSGGNSAEVR